MELGKVSIITPCYNGEKYVAKTIESVLAQTYSNWEMIIIDDERLIRNGCSVAQKKLRTHFSVGERIRLCSADGCFFGLGEVIPSEEDPSGAIKCIKLFSL